MLEYKLDCKKCIAKHAKQSFASRLDDDLGIRPVRQAYRGEPIDKKVF